MSDSVIKLIKEHENYIYTLVNKYGDTNNREDLYQQGVLGLLVAHRKFDKERYKVKFLTYAGYYVTKYILTYLKKDNDYIPIDIDKSNITNLRAESDYVRMQDIVDATIFKDRAIDSLYSMKVTERDIDIISSRYLNHDPETLQTLADKYGITRERVRQIETKWTNFLKKQFNIRG